MTLCPAINFMKKLHQSLTPNYSAVATNAAKKKLVSIMGQEGFASFMNANGGFNVKNMAKVIPAELARLGAGGAPAAATTAPVKQTIRLGATAPATPPTAPKPPVHQFIPAPKPSAPPAKPRAAGVRPDGSFNIVEAEARARQIFGSIPGMALNANEASRWASLESVFRVNGFAPPWTGCLSKTDAQIAKLNGPLFARRAKLIATLFQS